MVKSKKAIDNMVSLLPGTRVRLVGLRPKYINGATGTVMNGYRGRDKMEVELDYPRGRFGKQLFVPANALEKINE